ncbi:hypothetical protein Ciccas_011356 [Cichlidogyrus casuarinus]|uniref:C2 domain-containing protein n=1 Tax=Cichlidogyrus casuarinus TaxID=1844966 RepID=A0ABD2PSQ2_9PLAT
MRNKCDPVWGSKYVMNLSTLDDPLEFKVYHVPLKPGKKKIYLGHTEVALHSLKTGILTKHNPALNDETNELRGDLGEICFELKLNFPNSEEKKKKVQFNTMTEETCLKSEEVTNIKTSVLHDTRYSLEERMWSTFKQHMEKSKPVPMYPTDREADLAPIQKALPLSLHEQVDWTMEHLITGSAYNSTCMIHALLQEGNDSHQQDCNEKVSASSQLVVGSHPSAILHVVVIRMHNIFFKGSGNQHLIAPSTFVQVELSSERKHTKIVPQCSHPKFVQPFEFTLEPDSPNQLQFNVFHSVLKMK